MPKKLLILLIVFMLAGFLMSSEAKTTDIAPIVEFQTVDIGTPWVGGQLILDTSPEIPGRTIQPDNISLSYVLKPSGYSGNVLRGSIVYDMGGDMYYGVGAGWGQIEPVSFLFGKAKTGINIPVTDFLNLRGELIGYFPVWHLDEEDEQEVFFGANIGIRF